ncbi:MAG: hypothetical protein Q9186_001837 [Xanthomendoza sp. 1 TL-2023]
MWNPLLWTDTLAATYLPLMWKSLLWTDTLTATYLPLTWTRLHQWIALLSDQNLELYKPTDWLVSILPFYLLNFLSTLSIRFYHRKFPNSRTPLDVMTESRWVTCMCVITANWTWTALQYLWSQPDATGCIIALVDLGLEEVLIVVMTHIVVELGASLVDFAFGWQQFHSRNPQVIVLE